jgi:hypothetical protein
LSEESRSLERVRKLKRGVVSAGLAVASTVVEAVGFVKPVVLVDVAGEEPQLSVTKLTEQK